MPLSLEKDIEIRIFLKEVTDIRFVKLVRYSLEQWKIDTPVRGVFGYYSKYSCMLGAATKNLFKDCDVVEFSFLKLLSKQLSIKDSETSAIAMGFDYMGHDDLSSNKFCYWSNKISRIIFN